MLLKVIPSLRGDMIIYFHVMTTLMTSRVSHVTDKEEAIKFIQRIEEKVSVWTASYCSTHLIHVDHNITVVVSYMMCVCVYVTPSNFFILLRVHKYL